MIAELRQISVAELIKAHDEVPGDPWPDQQYYLDELRYRRQLELARQMHGLTRVMLALTIVIAWVGSDGGGSECMVSPRGTRTVEFSTLLCYDSIRPCVRVVRTGRDTAEWRAAS